MPRLGPENFDRARRFITLVDALYAVHGKIFDGVRREKLPVSVVAGQLRVQIETASLADGPTPFFELVRN